MSMRLMYSPTQQVFVFTFGDQTVPMGEKRFFQTKEEAIAAARSKGLKVDKKGFVSTVNPSDMNGLEADIDGRTLFRAETRGGKYQVFVYQTPQDYKQGVYSYKTYTSGKGDGGGHGFNLQQIRDRIRTLIRDAKEVDNINYHVVLDDMEVSPGNGFDGVSQRTRKGARVRFSPNPASHLLYSNPPAVGEEGTVTTMPGFGSRTYLPGPGGGLLYVKWDNHGTMGVSPNDLKKAAGRRSGKLQVGQGRPGQKFSHGDVEITTTLHPVKGFEGARGKTPVWFVVRSKDGPVLAVYGANLHLEAQAKAREIEKQTGVPVRVLQLHSRKRPTVGQHLDGVDVDDLDAFTRQYIETALWSSTGDDEEPLDKNYGPEDLSEEALAKMVEDSRKFQKENWDAISGDLSQAGHDFWLTRNGHGAGFWDGDWPDPLGDVLTAASKKFGEQWIYVGDDGKLYVQ